MTKERFTEIWNNTLGPAIESGAVIWECSPILEKYLLEISRMSDDEIWEKIMKNE